MKVLASLILIFILGFPGTSFAGRSGRSVRELPAPMLAYPGEEIRLDQDEIEFRWRQSASLSGFAYYDFRLYRGTAMVKDNLVMREKVPSRYSSIKVKSSLFEEGETYSWSLRLRDGTRDSRSNFSVFKAKR